MLKHLCTILLLCLCLHASAQGDAPYIQVLGIAQDGGYPHMGCSKQCCTRAWDDASMRRSVVCLALVDPVSKKWWLFEATPDIKEELHYFQLLTKGKYNYLPDGIFITHAHIGHYTGLMELGKEVMSTKNEPVYVLPKLKAFLENNGPWSQLVKLQNIAIQQLTADSAVQLTNGISVTAFTVPHRDEYSETAGFRIATPLRKYLFIPDINKWDLWDRDIIAQVKSVDIAMVDATCYDSTELAGRNKVILHPFVTETIDKFSAESRDMKSKIYFIHFNHTNPLLWDADKRKEVRKLGFNIAEQGEVL
jgi:pyrroloquinoline quinone biosynthesis protein B